MERAIIHYIKKESGKVDGSKDEDSINRIFDKIDSEINKVRKREVKRARNKRLKEWKRLAGLNCGHNNRKKRLKGRSKRGQL